MPALSLLIIIRWSCNTEVTQFTAFKGYIRGVRLYCTEGQNPKHTHTEKMLEFKTLKLIAS